MRLNRNKSSRRIKHTVRRKPLKPGRDRAEKRKANPTVKRAVTKLLTWARQIDPLAGDLTRAYNLEARARTNVNAGMFVAELQTRRRLLEELYCWRREAELKVHQDDGLSACLNEGTAIVNSLFEELKEIFGLQIVQEVDVIVKSPRPDDRRYRYANRYDQALNESKVLFPGLRQGGKVISPAEIEQVRNSPSTSGN